MAIKILVCLQGYRNTAVKFISENFTINDKRVNESVTSWYTSTLSCIKFIFRERLVDIFKEGEFQTKYRQIVLIDCDVLINVVFLLLLSRLSWFHPPTIGTNWPFLCWRAVKHQTNKQALDPVSSYDYNNTIQNLGGTPLTILSHVPNLIFTSYCVWKWSFAVRVWEVLPEDIGEESVHGSQGSHTLWTTRLQTVVANDQK